MIRASFFHWVCLPVIAFAGCGSSRATVEGTVTLRGEAIERGVIHFIPAADTGEPAQASIIHGKYRHTDLTPGVYMIRISSPQVTGKKIKLADDAPGAAAGAEADEVREAVPDEYNRNSSLQREFKPGSNVVDFSL